MVFSVTYYLEFLSAITFYRYVICYIVSKEPFGPLLGTNEIPSKKTYHNVTPNSK